MGRLNSWSCGAAVTIWSWTHPKLWSWELDFKKTASTAAFTTLSCKILRFYNFPEPEVRDQYWHSHEKGPSKSANLLHHPRRFKLFKTCWTSSTQQSQSLFSAQPLLTGLGHLSNKERKRLQWSVTSAEKIMKADLFTMKDLYTKNKETLHKVDITCSSTVHQNHYTCLKHIMCNTPHLLLYIRAGYT